MATGPLDTVQPEGVELFKQHLTANVMTLSDLFFKGDKGFALAPDGTRVVIGDRQKARQRPERSRHLKLVGRRCIGRSKKCHSNRQHN